MPTFKLPIAEVEVGQVLDSQVDCNRIWYRVRPFNWGFRPLNQVLGERVPDSKDDSKVLRIGAGCERFEVSILGAFSSIAERIVKLASL